MISKLSTFTLKNVFVILSTIIMVSAVGTARAQSPVGVAAVVNDEPISIIDLVERLKLVAVSSNIEMTAQKSNEMAPQILQQLINEKLQMQEAERRGIEVKQSDIDVAKATIEKNAGLPDGMLDQFLEQRGVAPSTIEEQIKPQVAWQKLLGTMRRDVEISDAEIDENLARIESNQGKPRNRVQEIFLPVDNPQDSAKVYQTAQEVLQALSKGADFGGLARQISASTSAATGGDMGWLYAGEISSQLQQAINQLEPGQVSAPIQTIRGYYIIKLLDRRRGDAAAITDTRLDLYQLFVPVSESESEEQIKAKLDVLNNTKQTADSCQALANVAVDLGSELSGEMKGISPNDLSGPVSRAVSGLEKGQVSDIIRVDGGALLVMVCDKTEKSNLPDRKSVENRLLMERLDILARRKLRELRREAFIDIRI